MTNYEIAFEQFHEETGWGMKRFEKDVEEYGWDYVKYYYERWVEVMCNSGYNLDPEGY